MERKSITKTQGAVWQFVLIGALGLTVSFALLGVLQAGRVANTSAGCADVLMLFARGSSSNKNGLYLDQPYSEEFRQQEEVPGSFFHWMDLRLKADYPHISYKAVSVHNAGRMWSVNGYPAVGAFSLPTINNVIQAELLWWPAGQYRDSVSSGSDELVGWVRDAIAVCPQQRIVVGGYSQGAQVVHESLKKLAANERNQIDNVVLFGDPKFIGAEYNRLNPFDKPRAYPWHRGTAGLRERGIADAESPYVPNDMSYKTISWCHEDDFVCTGLSGLGWSITNHELPSNGHSIWDSPSSALGAGHTRYPLFGVPEATDEIVANLHSLLEPLEFARGGLTPKNVPNSADYVAGIKNTRPTDLMFALNKVGGNEDAIAQFYQNLSRTVNSFGAFFTNIYSGGAVYGDYIPGVSGYVSAYTQAPNDLTAAAADITRYSPYIYGGALGGGDYPENHGMAIERISQSTSWRKDAVKHLVLFVERPATESYALDICDTTTASVLRYGSSSPCTTPSVSARSHPQYCSRIVLVIVSDTCAINGGADTRIVSRSLEDALTLARARGFVIDVIVPHMLRSNQPGYTPSSGLAQLQHIAESTGGLYLQYGDGSGRQGFSEADLQNAVWQILNHQPKLMTVAAHTPGSYLKPTAGESFLPPSSQTIQPTAAMSTQLSVTALSSAQSYVWSFGDSASVEVTAGPSLEHAFTNNTQQLMSVVARSAPAGLGDPIGQTVAVVQPPTPAAADTVPYRSVQQLDPLEQVQVLPARDSSVTITWRPITSVASLVIVSDPSTGIIMASAPASAGSMRIALSVMAGDTITLRVVGGQGESEPQQYTTSIAAEASTPPVVVFPLSSPPAIETLALGPSTSTSSNQKSASTSSQSLLLQESVGVVSTSQAPFSGMLQSRVDDAQRPMVTVLGATTTTPVIRSKDGLSRRGNSRGRTSLSWRPSLVTMAIFTVLFVALVVLWVLYTTKKNDD